ncbi:hypothetical protein NM688_g7847 [Phlebia brevispora]|uniref:Uncharacterized protein n=1 Tax=Phlebia brevispora TaxID=194682 RepID=A0ACC1S0Z4_9APHY|nr:hypothetical protein NM688_g7847 [Phlebia brevispora]
MSVNQPNPDRFNHEDDEGPVGDENNLDQDGNTDKPKVPKQHTPFGLNADTMVLTDHSRASVHVYIREDLKNAQRVKYNTFVEAIFGITPQKQTEWMAIIAKEKWHDDEVISAQLTRFCKATTEVSRYEPLSNIINRIMEMAHGRLPGVPDTYPIDDICVKRNDPFFIRPIEAHRELGAKRKPDLITLRGRHAVNLPPPKADNTLLPRPLPPPPPPESPTLSATVAQHLEEKANTPEKQSASPASTSTKTGRSVATPANPPEGSVSPTERGSPEENHGGDAVSSAVHSASSPPSPERKKRRASAQGVRWVDDIMNWELKGSSKLTSMLDSFKDDRKHSTIPSSEPDPGEEALPSRAASSTWEDDSETSDYDESASVGMKRRRRQSDLIDCVRLPEPPSSAFDNMAKEEREPYDLRNASIQTGSYALETLACTFGTRLFCVNVLFHNDRLYLWFYDACGYVYTDSISFIEDFERAAALFVGIACATPAQLGALPPVIKPPRLAPYPKNWPPENLKGHTFKVPRTISAPGGKVTRTQDVHLTLQDSVFTQYVLAGRRTFVYTVKTRPSISKRKLIVKLSYQVTRRWKEHELIETAAKAGVDHLPTVHAHGDLWKMSDGVRKIFYSKEKTEYEDRTLRAIIYNEYLPLETLFPTSPESIPLMAYQMIDCECIVVSMISATKLKILHRDISVNNVMYERRNGRLYFILIDFDMATIVSDNPNVPYKCRSKHRTGTLAFMAVKLIEDAARTLRRPDVENGPHLLSHDLESIFWLCLWCTLVLVEADSKQQREEYVAIVRAWETKDLWMIASRKRTIQCTELALQDIDLSTAAINAGLGQWFRIWAQIWNDCNAHINRYDLKCNTARYMKQPLPVMDWETVDGLLTRDNLREQLTAFIPDPYAPRTDMDKPPADPAKPGEHLPANVTDVPGDTIEAGFAVDTAIGPEGTPATTSDDITGHAITGDNGVNRRRTRASARLAAAKAAPPVVRKVETRKAKPVSRRARSPTREQGAEIMRKANAAAKCTAKKASAAVKKMAAKETDTTRKMGTTKKDGYEEEG